MCCAVTVRSGGWGARGFVGCGVVYRAEDAGEASALAFGIAMRGALELGVRIGLVL